MKKPGNVDVTICSHLIRIADIEMDHGPWRTFVGESRLGKESVNLAKSQKIGSNVKFKLETILTTLA